MRITEDKMPQAQQQGLRSGGLSVRASPESMGGMLARGVSSLAGSINEVQEANDAAEAKELEIKIAEKHAAIMRELNEKKGKDAMDSATEIKTRLESAVREVYEESNPSAGARKRADMAVGMDIVTKTDYALRYGAEQNKVHLNSVSDAFIQSKIDLAVNDYGNNDQLTDSLDDIRIEMEDRGKREGWPPEVIKQKTSEMESKIHTGVIDQYISDKDFDKAKAYYSAPGVKESMPGMQAKIEKKIEDGLQWKTVNKHADAIFGSDPEASLESMRKQVSAIKGIDDETRKSIQGLLEYRKNIHIADVQRAHQDVYEGFAVQMERDGLKITDLDQVKLWELPASMRHALMNFEKAKASGLEVETNKDQFMELRRRLDEGEITSREQIEAYSPVVAKSDLKSVLSMWEKRDTVPPKDIRDAYLTSKGLSKINQASDDYVAFTRWAGDKIRENHRPEDIQLLADQWAMKGSRKDSSAFNPFAPDTYGEAYRKDPKGIENFIIKTPEEEAETIEAAKKMVGASGSTDLFTTRVAVPAKRWLAARGEHYTPQNIALYASLEQIGLKQTSENFSYARTAMAVSGHVNLDTIDAVRYLESRGLAVNKKTVYATAKQYEQNRKAKK